MRNWTVKEAVATINAGTDLEGIQEIAKHFPLFFMAACKNDLSAASQLMTDKFTLNRLTKVPVEANADEDTDGAAEAVEDAGDEDLESMSTKQLIALCGKRGIKVPKYGKNKQFYIDALAGGSDDDADAEDETEEAEDGYEGKSAKELFELCKERGIKAQPKRKAAEYIKLLEAADAEAGEEEDWEDEEEEEKAPKAKSTKSSKATSSKGKSTKGSKAAAKKEEPEEDEDDDDGEDWDI